MPRILVVEDDAELRQIYRSALEREKLEVFEASDGQDALDNFTAIAPDLVILDMMMPRLDGEALLAEIRARPDGDRVRMVVITAFPQYREQALNFNVDQFLTKPVRPSEIVHAVLAALKA
jgi:two-component system, OmpR family, response regulator